MPSPPFPTMTVAPTNTPTLSTCVDIEVVMSDSYGDGWNNGVLFVGEISLTLPYGSFQSEVVCLDPGEYSPYSCGSEFPSEITWHFFGPGISFSASDDSSCSAQGTFVVVSPPTPEPTPVTPAPSLSIPPSPAPSATNAPTLDECFPHVVTMWNADTWSTWNGNTLHLGDFTFSKSSYGTQQVEVCLPPREYTPYCCGGAFISGIGWSVSQNGAVILSGGATSGCYAFYGSFTSTAPHVRYPYNAGNIVL
jgi:hypothetical protein